MRVPYSHVIFAVLFPLFFSCQSSSSSEFKDALTFYVSFDHGTTADFALGDAQIYTAKSTYIDSRRSLDEIEMGVNRTNHGIVKGKGRFGDAFEFREKSSTVHFYKSKGNIAYNSQDWSGTISFWLSVDPSADIDGYTDPVQITDTEFNDASIWVDFTDPAPNNFRLGVIGDKKAWTLDTLNTSVKEVFEKRIVTVTTTPFSRSTWTHVLITYDGLGTANSLASLYLNGEKVGSVNGVDDPFSWDLEKSNIFLGLNFSGLMDELSIFNKPLTYSQVKELYRFKEGIKSIL